MAEPKQPSPEAMKFVARWACDLCSPSLGPDDPMPDCEYCTDHRQWHAGRLDAFATSEREAISLQLHILRGKYLSGSQAAEALDVLQSLINLRSAP